MPLVCVPELADHTACAYIPHLDRLIVASANETSSARVEGQSPHKRSVTTERAKMLTCRGRPDFDIPVGGPRTDVIIL